MNVPEFSETPPSSPQESVDSQVLPEFVVGQKGKRRYAGKFRGQVGVRVFSQTLEAATVASHQWYARNNLVRFQCPMPKQLSVLVKAAAQKANIPLWKFVSQILEEALTQDAPTPEHATSAEDLLG